MPPVNSVAALKARFNTAVEDRKVTKQEVEELINQVKDGGGVTNSERRQLREQFIVHGDVFEADAKERLQAFISDEIPQLLIDDPVVGGDHGDRRDLADPAVMTEDKDSLKYEWTTGALTVDGISHHDVVQGMIGDCYMMAGFSSVAFQNPEMIDNAIRDNGDGTFTVRFFDVPYYGEPRAVEVTVDGQLPVRYGGLHYGKGKDRSELWVPLLEKAYAEWKGGYDAIGKGGSAGAVMEALTGRRDSYTSISESSDSRRLFDEIKTALASDKAVAAGTHGESATELYRGTGVYAHHAYSIVGVEEGRDGKLYVELRNPWGEVEPAGNGPDDGVFKLAMQTFQRLYSSLYVS